MSNETGKNEPPRWLRRWVMYVVAPLGAVGASAAVALAVPVPNTFKDGDKLTATAMNANFKVLDDATSQLKTDVASLQTFVGFSAVKTAGDIPANTFTTITGYSLEFSSQPGAFDAIKGVFTAPLTGYYRLSTSGFSKTPTASQDTRVSFVFVKNGDPSGMGGGQLSVGDSPLPSVSQILLLTKGDQVVVQAFSAAAFTLGGFQPFWFQGQYLGK